MSNPSPSRASSRSPHPSTSNTSPRRSPRSSPKRKPLLERSDSQKNAAYNKSPLATLSSSSLASKTDLYAFGEELHPAVRPTSPTIPPKSSKRPSRASGTLSIASALDGSSSGRSIYPYPDVPPLFSGRPSSQVAAVTDKADDAGPSRVRRRTLTSAAKPIEAAPSEAASTGVDTGESSIVGAQRTIIPVEPSHSPEALIIRKKHQQGPSDVSSVRVQHHKSVERLRSQSSSMSLSRSIHSGKLGQFEFPRPSGERPRSSSSPSAPTDEFIKALISSGTNVQYPKLRKPSATSLRSDSAHTGAAYPPPLRLQRKRANSQLARAAGIAPESLEPYYASVSGSGREGLLKPYNSPSQASFMTHTSEGSTTTWSGSYPAYALGHHGRWRSEIDDTVAELQTRSLKRQKGNYHDGSSNRLQTPSRESLRSSVGSFYHFLNDSRTAWAQFYYRGEAKLTLETPPNGEDTSSSQPPDQEQRQEQQQEDQPRPHTSNTSGRTRSPGSFGFPDRIHVPRVRPLRRPVPTYHSSHGVRHVIQDSSSSPYLTTDSDSSIIPRPFAQHSSSSPYGTSGTDSSALRGNHTYLTSSSSADNIRTIQPGQNRPFRTPYFPSQGYPTPPRTRPSSLPLARPSPPNREFSFSPSEETTVTALPEMRMVGNNRVPLTISTFSGPVDMPHLSPNRRIGPWLPYWRAPSIDETEGLFERSNFQLILFCVGFLLPPAWWVAAFLPLPKRPQWERGRRTPRVWDEHSVDLFDSIDVYRYQKAQWWRNLNRFMSLAGVLIVAAIIACVVVSTT